MCDPPKSYTINPLIRPLRAIANAGDSDRHLLCGRAADEIERLEKELEHYAKPLSG